MLALVRAGAIDGLSIGFRTVKARTDPRSRIRKLDMVDLGDIDRHLPAAHERARRGRRAAARRVRIENAEVALKLANIRYLPTRSGDAMSRYVTEFYFKGGSMFLGWANEQDYERGRIFLRELTGFDMEPEKETGRTFCLLETDEQFDAVREFRRMLKRERAAKNALRE